MRLSRRQMLVASAVGVSGVGAFSMTTEAAEANIEFGSFNVGNYSTTAGESSDAILTVDSEVSYAATRGVDEISVELEIGRTAARTNTIDSVVVETGTKTYEDTITLEGSLFSTGAFTQTRLDSKGEFEVHAKLIMRAFRGDEEIAVAAELDSFTITVEQGEFRFDGQISATGEVKFRE